MPKGVSFTSDEVRGAILRFLDGNTTPWEWDDFTSVPISNPFFDAVRLLCVHIRDAYPPPDGTQFYCSGEGAELMRELAKRLP